MKKIRHMKLQTRIMVSFFIAIILPIVLAAVCFVVIFRMALSSFGEQYGIENPTYGNLYNNVLMLSRMMDEELGELEELARNDPQSLEDRAYLQKLNMEFGDDNSYIVVMKDQTIYFNGSGRISDGDLLASLPEYSADEDDEGRIYILHVDEQTLMKNMGYTFRDGSPGAVFVVVSLSTMLPELRSALTLLIIAVIIILAATSLAVSMWIYRGVAIPLAQLKRASRSIRDGNLDFEVQPADVEEINDLCISFEEMRLRLKKNAEEKMEYDRESRELISNISYDLKTPITAVKGYCEGIIDGVADTPEKMDRYVRTIYNKTIEMDRLINELTFYAKIDTNKVPYTFTKVGIRSFVGDFIEEINLEMEQQHIALEYSDELTEEIMVIADPEQIMRVINNIISNSVKYMDKPEKKIRVILSDAGDFVQLAIEDNGKGIAQKDLPHIFDRFYRTDASRNSTRGGSGIGLSIVKKIMEDHGGKVWASSVDGEGTTMYLVLRKYTEVIITRQERIAKR